MTHRVMNGYRVKHASACKMAICSTSFLIILAHIFLCAYFFHSHGYHLHKEILKVPRIAYNNCRTQPNKRFRYRQKTHKNVKKNSRSPKTQFHKRFLQSPFRPEQMHQKLQKVGLADNKDNNSQLIILYKLGFAAATNSPPLW